VANDQSSNVVPVSPRGSAAAIPPDFAGRVERLFLPRPGPLSRAGLIVGGLGCTALGAGVYGAWLRPEAISGAGVFLLSGLAACALAWVLSTRHPPEVRVGALGVTLGDPTEATRWAWCDITRLHVVGDRLRIETSGAPLELSLTSHGPAAARVLSEAALRIGGRVDISPRVQERLPSLADTDGEIVPAGRLQIAGRKCLASGTSLTVESDAQLCDNCAALYHRQHAPAQCVSCGHALAAPSRGKGALAAS
jgi:ribosomal protein S27E